MESRALTLTMLSSLIIANLLVLFTVQESRQTSNGNHFLHIEDLKPVNATLGDNVTLPCNFSTDNSMELTMLVISWSKDGKIKWAFSKDSQEDESVLEELSKGKADLHLVHVQQEDGGIYTCAIKYRSLEKHVNTTVLIKDPEGLQNAPDSRNGIVSSLDFTPISQNPKDSRPPSTLASKEDVDSSLHFTQPFQSSPDSILHSIPVSKKPKVLGSAIISNDEFRTLKLGMVAAVLVASWGLIVFIYFCLPGSSNSVSLGNTSLKQETECPHSCMCGLSSSLEQLERERRAQLLHRTKLEVYKSWRDHILKEEIWATSQMFW